MKNLWLETLSSLESDVGVVVNIVIIIYYDLFLVFINRNVNTINVITMLLLYGYM